MDRTLQSQWVYEVINMDIVKKARNAFEQDEVKDYRVESPESFKNRKSEVPHDVETPREVQHHEFDVDRFLSAVNAKCGTGKVFEFAFKRQGVMSISDRHHAILKLFPEFAGDKSNLTNLMVGGVEVFLSDNIYELDNYSVECSEEHFHDMKLYKLMLIKDGKKMEEFIIK